MVDWLWSGGFSRRNLNKRRLKSPLHDASSAVSAGNELLTHRRIKVVEQNFLDPHSPINESRNRLPHWQQTGATYFVTFRLADSIPRALLRQWEEEQNAWSKFHAGPRTPAQEGDHRGRFGLTIERWLDNHHGTCVLRLPDVQNIMANTLMRFQADRYKHHSWVVMPNHIHALFSLYPTWTLERILQQWKGRTAREINRRQNTSGTVWQKDYFDRLIRSEKHFWHCAAYLRENPANLQQGDYLLWESEEIRGALGSSFSERRLQPPEFE